eukprot:gene8495-4856_t
MEGLKEAYLAKSGDFACEPIKALLDDLDTAGDSLLPFVRPLYEDTIIGELDLSYNRLDDLAAQSVARLIKMNRSIHRINLNGNNISHVGATYLAEALSEPGVTLEWLQLAGNGDIGDDGFASVGEMLR